MRNRLLTPTFLLSAVLSGSACGEGDSVPDTCAGVEETKDNREYAWAVIQVEKGYAPAGRPVSLPLLTISNGGFRRLCTDRLEMRIGEGEWQTLPDVTLPLVLEGGESWTFYFDINSNEVGLHSFEVRARVNDPLDSRPHVFPSFEVFEPPASEGDPCWKDDANCPGDLVCYDGLSIHWGHCV
jgi:hypothetical protein